VDRRAVALDDGRLVFVDTEDLTIDPGINRSVPDPDTNVDSDPAGRTSGRHRGE
jgi:hypothetical protein